jgi:hypothetical protein
MLLVTTIANVEQLSVIFRNPDENDCLNLIRVLYLRIWFLFRDEFQGFCRIRRVHEQKAQAAMRSSVQCTPVQQRKKERTNFVFFGVSHFHVLPSTSVFVYPLYTVESPSFLVPAALYLF